MARKPKSGRDAVPAGAEAAVSLLGPIADVWTDSIDSLADVYGRGRVLLSRRLCPCEATSETLAEIAAVRDNFDRSIKALLALRAAPVHDVKSGFASLQQAVSLVQATARLLPAQDDNPANAARLAQLVLPPSFQYYLFQDLLEPGPPAGIPPEQIEPFLVELIRLLREAIQRAIESDVPEEIIKELQRILGVLLVYLKLVRDGRHLPFGLVRTLLMWLYRVLLRLGPRGARLLGGLISLIIGFLESLGMAFGADASVAALAGGGILLAIVAAAVGGCLLGRWIGRQRVVGETTVDDLVADAWYIRLYAAPDGCDDLWEAYLQAKARRRDYEASGPTVDKSIAGPLLAREVALLDKYLKNACDPDSGHAMHRELERQSARLKFLLP